MNFTTLLTIAFDGDIEMSDVRNIYSYNFIQTIDSSIIKHEDFFIEHGHDIPFPGDNDEYDDLLRKDKGIQNLQKVLEFFN